jgi:hypothetical protein
VALFYSEDDRYSKYQETCRTHSGEPLSSISGIKPGQMIQDDITENVLSSLRPKEYAWALQFLD